MPTAFFDLGRIAYLGVFFYLVMDILVHWGVWRNLREKIEAASWFMLTAIGLDVVVLGTFAMLKWQGDPLIVAIAIAAMATVFAFERIFLDLRPPEEDPEAGEHSETGDGNVQPH